MWFYRYAHGLRSRRSNCDIIKPGHFECGLPRVSSGGNDLWYAPGLSLLRHGVQEARAAIGPTVAIGTRTQPWAIIRQTEPRRRPVTILLTARIPDGRIKFSGVGGWVGGGYLFGV